MALIAVVAFAMVMAFALLVGTIKTGSAGVADGPAAVPADAINLHQQQIVTQSAVSIDRSYSQILLPNGTTMRVANGSIERYYSQSAARGSLSAGAVLAKPVSGYTQAEAQRGRHGQLP